MKHTKSETSSKHSVKVECDDAVEQSVESNEAEMPATEEQPAESELDSTKKACLLYTSPSPRD